MSHLRELKSFSDAGLSLRQPIGNLVRYHGNRSYLSDPELAADYEDWEATEKDRTTMPSITSRRIQNPENLAALIYLLRGEKVLLSEHLAELYVVPVKVLNQAVKRNIDRFPDDFMFQLTRDETDAILRLRSQSVTLKRGEHIKYLPYAFTEQGVAMLSSVLRSPRAVEVNIAIMRTFVQLRRLMDSNRDLARRIEAMEKRYDEQFASVFDAIKRLIAEDEGRKTRPKRSIGFLP